MNGPDWAELDRRHVWHPYTQHAVAPLPIPITRAEGAFLYDQDGRQILDAISSWWVTLHGHAHPVIAQAVAEQARRLEQVIFAGMTHEPAARLAAELVERLPNGLERIFYSDNGSTAVEVALKMAIQYWRNQGQRRRTIVALDHAYHGDTVGAMSASGRGIFTSAFDSLLFDVIRLTDPSEGDTVAAFRRVLDRRGRDVAAVIVEPLLLGAGGMRMWSAETLRELTALTHQVGTLLIADEVLTGFGRTGPLFACERAVVTPDILCLSKGLTGGFLPLGVTAATAAVFEAFWSDDRNATFFHGHSYTANPIACAAARASLSLLDEGSGERRAALEAGHRRGLERLEGLPGVFRPRVLGTVAAFDLAESGGYLAPIGAELARFGLERGILLRPLGNVVYLMPPYCTTTDQLEGVYQMLAQFLEGR